MNEVCILCGKTASLMCQRCMETYCSTNCQILDWRTHKKICFNIPPLVPIKDFINKDLSSLLNRSCVFESSPRNRSLNESVKSTKRNQARNPLKIPTEECLIQVSDTTSPETNTKNPPVDLDFTLKPKHTPKEKETKSGISVCSKISTPAVAWRTPYNYPEDVFFDVIVQYVEEGKNTGIVWVTDIKYESPLRKLLAEINRNIDVNTPRCRSEEIQIGALIAAPFEHLFYRAEIIEINEDSNTAIVHLIDYGNIVDLPLKELRSPIPIMRNLNAYAFRIRYANQIALETVLTIRVLGIDENGIAKIEEKTNNTVPVGLTAAVFANNPAVSLVKLSESGLYALLSLCDEAVSNQLKEMHELLLTDTRKQLNLDKPASEGQFIAALALNGWSRALIMSTYRNYYLVYLLDIGRVSLVEEVCNIPEKYNTIPMQVFAVELIKIVGDGKSFTDCLFHGQKFTIKAHQSLKTGGNDRIPAYILTDAGNKIAEVETFSYFGKCEKVGVSDWVEPLISGSSVHVTNVISHSEVYISLVCTKMYPKIITAAAEDCETISSCQKGDLVLAQIESEYFRGKSLESAKKDFVKVQNVDTGRVLDVSTKTMRKPNLFVISCPYHSQKVKLMYLSNVATPYTENKALATLKQCQLNGAEFTLQFTANPEQGVELLLQTPDRQSLNKQLLPMLFENTPEVEGTKQNEIIQASAKTPTPSVPVTGDKKTFTMKDLEVIPITCGDNVPIMVTDSSTISKGYISGFDLTNKDFLKKLETEYLPLVAKHCASSNIGTEYSPDLDEICLAVYDADKEWYRALCINKMKNDMFFVMFLDFGNMCAVHKSNIRPITKELMFPANANMCSFEGIPEDVPPKACEKFILATQADPKLIAKVTKLEQDSYLLSLKNMDKYF